MPSTVIRRFAYDPDTRRLLIEFVSRRRYVYADVPFEILESLQASRSKGAYFNKHIRDHFAHTELDATD